MTRARAALLLAVTGACLAGISATLDHGPAQFALLLTGAACVVAAVLVDEGP